MKIRMLVTALAVALITGISASAQDKPAGKPGHEGHRPMGLLPPPMVEKLTADQKAKYDAIVVDFQKDIKAAKESGDKEKMGATFKTYRAKVDEILTDDQKAELKKMREAHGTHGGHGKPGGAPAPKPNE